MRYGAIGDNPIEEQMLASPQAPRALADTFLPLVQAQAIMVGVRFGLFEALRAGSRTCEVLALSLNVDAEGLELVLRLLVGGGYLSRENGCYGLTELAQQTLLEDAPARVVAFVGLNELLWDSLGHTADVIRSGRGVDLHGTLSGSANWATYQAAMLEIARQLAPAVATVVPVKDGARTLVDIGGSHGLYGALIARQHPPMRSVVLDLPEAVEQSRHLAHEEGIDDVVSHVTGDALVGDLGEGHDVVFLGNILHHFSPMEIAGLLARIKAALNPDGTVAIWEMRRPEPDAPSDVMGDGFALLFRVTSTARCYATSEYLDWLREAGFVDVQAHPFSPAPFQVLATGRAPA